MKPLAIVVFTLFAVSMNAGVCEAAIQGKTGTEFDLVARAGHITTGDGDSVLMWGYAFGNGLMQYPGPTLIVNEGDLITVRLKNELSEPVSIIFPGQDGVLAIGGNSGLLTREAPPDGATVVTYTFVASNPGTYMYHSGTRVDFQVEMGLTGALIVRPSSGVNRAYNHPQTSFDREYLFVLSEIDPSIHELVELGRRSEVDMSRYFPVLWFLNGRTSPDTMADDGAPWLPHQPYGCLPRLHPGEIILTRVIGGGRDLHPFHPHGNHLRIIGENGRLLESAPGAGPDLSYSDFTLTVVPGSTYDALFTWTGEKLGWDIYGHGPGDPLQPNEYAPDHGKPLPVQLPEKQNLMFGNHYSGSPFLGAFGDLPPGTGGMNASGGLFFMWHSHTEKEIVNNDIFPGGMMTMLIVEPPAVRIP